MPIPVRQNVVEVQAEDLDVLESVLKAKLPSSALVYNVLKLKQAVSEGDKISVRIYADEPIVQWNNNTTTFMGVANVKNLPQNLVVINGPTNGSSEEAILHILSVLDWTRENQFEGVENSFVPTLINKAKSFGTIEEHDPIGLYYMNKEEALEILTDKENKLITSSTLRGSSLKPSDADMIQDRWPEKRPGYLDMLQASIELCSSGGVYVSEDISKACELVSFAVALPFGSIHALHTEVDHRRKGYGKITMKVLVKNIAQAGRIPLVQIFKSNDGSKSLNEGIGFKFSHDINLIHFYPTANN